MSADGGSAQRPQFSVGDEVRVTDRRSAGHCRTPFYLRGSVGTVVDVVGRYRNPEQLAYHKPGLPKHFLYRVRFQEQGLWDDYGGTAGDQLEADVYEHWLDPGRGEMNR